MKQSKYNPTAVEKRWQAKWERTKNYRVSELPSKKKTSRQYVLNMFPYPSAAGLHVGHALGWVSSDVFTRWQRMNGKYVLYPIGFDSFGLPAENYAIKTKIHPAKTTKTAISNFIKALKALGISCDWSRIISTCEPEYYKWTQWLFLQLYKKGLAYKKKAPVNWCTNCQTVLAREQVVSGKCERCKGEVMQKELEQWFFRITAFAERLIEDLDGLDWPNFIKESQRNWIGRSLGAEINFAIDGASQNIKIFTTRPDTLLGATYVVLAPEHPLIDELKPRIENWKEVENYIKKTLLKSELERTDLAKKKTGTQLKGIFAVNPINREKIPIYTADYVIMNYGTGAVMAVPAHDKRDYEFAEKYGLSIKQVISSFDGKVRSYLKSVQETSDEELKKMNIEVAERYKDGSRGLVIPPESLPEYEELINNKLMPGTWNEYLGKETVFIFKHTSGRIERCILTEITEKIIEELIALFLKREKIGVYKWLAQNVFYKNLIIHENPGKLINSQEFDGRESEETKWSITEKAGGTKKIQYRLRDWLISRQRYWGAPIPIIYCNKCGEVPVPEKDLPVKLPKDVDFLPHGQSPLTKSKSFHRIKCPKCGAKEGVRRESDTMDTFVDSSWYFLRYTDPKNKKEYAKREKIHYWNPVDWYIGGAEHAVLHLLYARFFVKVLFDQKKLKFNEPFLRLRSHGVILGEDGQKMSKSIGNVVPLTDMLKKVGADTLRMYEMFMGPFEDTKPWSSSSIMGVKRFLDRIHSLNNILREDGYAEQNDYMRPLMHRSIQKIEKDINAFKFNTCISQLMILFNDLEKNKPALEEWVAFLRLLTPFAPHLTNELALGNGKTKTINLGVWPKSNTKATADEDIKIAVQVQGKLRGMITVSKGSDESTVSAKAQQDKKVKQNLENKRIKKIVFVQDRIINFVIE